MNLGSGRVTLGAESRFLVGVSRREQPDDDFRAFASEAIGQFSRRTPDPDVLEGLLGRLRDLLEQ